MLVAAFKIEVGGPLQIGPAPAFQHEGMGAARIEPHVENVCDHLVIVGVVIGAEIFRLARFLPRIDAFPHDGSNDAVIYLWVGQIGAIGPHEQRDRHAPCALAGKHPVGPPFNHRADAVAALFGDEGDAGDFFDRNLSQRHASGSWHLGRLRSLARGPSFRWGDGE